MSQGQFRGEEERQFTIGEIIRAMENPHYPDFVVMVAGEIQAWMASVLANEEAFFAGEDNAHESPADVEALYERLSWIESFCDLLPGPSAKGFEDAVVVSVLAPETDEGLRLAVDHAALFARGVCRKVWVFCDNWIIGDALRYQQHVKALTEQGIEFHFLLVTPWGWTEIPLGRQAGVGRSLKWRNDMRNIRNTARRKKEE